MSELIKILERVTADDFAIRVGIFNDSYELDSRNLDPAAALQRLKNFRTILQKEVDELTEIVDKLQADVDHFGNDPGTLPVNYTTKVELLVDLADFCADVQVYCESEMLRWGIPSTMMKRVVMASNMSKMGADGKPIKDPETGKVEKGPGYWKPEPLMHQLLLKVLG